MADHIIDGYAALAPWAVAENTGALLDFITVAFGGEEVVRVQLEGGSISHAEIRLGEVVVLAFDGRPGWPAMPSSLRVWVPDVGAAMRAAIFAGATPITPISDTDVGLEGGRLLDPFGNIWWVVARVGTVGEESMWDRSALPEHVESMRIPRAPRDIDRSGSAVGRTHTPVASEPIPPGDINVGLGETERRRDIIDLARRTTHRSRSVQVSKSYRDQDAWVDGSITLDTLVARSQGVDVGATSPAARVLDPAAGPTPASPLDADAVNVLSSLGTSAVSRSTDVAAAQDLELLAVTAARETEAAVAAAATRTLQAACIARADRSAAATKVALATAETVREAAHLLQVHADEDASLVTIAAAEAAYLVAMSVAPGTEAVQAEKAALLAATIRAAAVTKAEETALAAATVARAAATAAADAAATAADAAMALELQVADTAAAVQAVATATAQRVVVSTIQAAELLRAGDR